MTKKVFISGSRQLKMLPKVAKQTIDTMIDGDFEIIIGDSEKGIDRKIIDYLRVVEYKNVHIYGIYEEPRVNKLETWQYTRVDIPYQNEYYSNFTRENESMKPRQAQMVKDAKMSELCDSGFVIWKPLYMHQKYRQEAVSAGSMRNMIQMLLSKKSVELIIDNSHELDENAHIGDCEFKTVQLKEIADLEEQIHEFIGDNNIDLHKNPVPKDERPLLAREYAKYYNLEMKKIKKTENQQGTFFDEE